MGAVLPIILPIVSAIISMIASEPPAHAPSVSEVDNYPRPEWLTKNNVNWAVTGQSGAGKSALINGLRNVKKGELGWAPEGTSETTMDPTPFKIPSIPQSTIWDLPGSGTNAHPQESYVKDKGIRWFHGVIIAIKDGRPQQFDSWLVQTLENYRVPYYVVQNRFQQACEGEYVDTDDAQAVARLATKVKKEVYQKLIEGGATAASLSRIFMVNSRKFGFADGIALKDTVMADLAAQQPK